MPAQLIGLRGSLIGRTVPLGTGESVLGREAGNQIVVDDQTVGRRHAAIRPAAASYVIEDLGSTNGTFVNEVRISGATVLRPGDTIRVGEQLLRFESSAGQPKVAAPPKIEVGRREAAAGGPPPPQRVPLFESRGVVGSGAGCVDINLEGCIKWLIIALIVLAVATLIVVFLMTFTGILGGVFAGGRGAAGGGAAPGTGGGSNAGGSGGESPPPAPTAQGGPVRIIDVKVDFGQRAGFTGPIPIVLITWQNVGDKPLSQVRANVNGFDAQGRPVGTVGNVTIYNGAAVAPGEEHKDTLAQGGVPAVPGPSNKLREAPKTATVDVLDAR